MNFKTFLVNLFTEPVNEPVRLEKQEEPVSMFLKEKLNQWVERNFYLIALAVMLIALLTVILVCFIWVGSSVESGNYYYHIKGVI